MSEISFGGKTHPVANKPLVEKGFWCRHGFHRNHKWGDDFDQLEVCRKCGIVYKAHVYFGFMDIVPVRTLVGYVNPAELLP